MQGLFIVVCILVVVCKEGVVFFYWGSLIYVAWGLGIGLLEGRK